MDEELARPGGPAADEAAEPAPLGWDDWRRRVEEESGPDAVERRLVRASVEGLRIEPLYSADHPSPAGPRPPWPGARGWRAWQRYRHPDLRRVGRGVARDAERGLEGAWLVLPEVARRGRPGPDADGVPLAGSLELAEAMSRLPPGRLTLGIDGGAAGTAAGAVLVAAAGRRGVFHDRLGAVLGLDPLGDAAVDGFAPELPLDLGLGAARWAAASAPGVVTFVARGGPYHEAGADAGLEVGLALAAAATYLRRLIDEGLEPTVAARQVSLSLALGRDLYLQVAKLRAVRWLWEALLARWGAGGASWRLHGETARRGKTVYDPWNNALRESLEAMAGVFGGCTDLTTRPWSAVRGTSSEPARRLAIHTHNLLRDESLLAAVADPLRGSHYVEALTRDLARIAWDRLREVEGAGGFPAALAAGLVADRVEEAADRRRALIDHGRLALTGVTEFPDPAERLEAPEPAPAAHDADGSAAPAEPAANERLARLRTLAAREPAAASTFEAAVAAAGAGAPLRALSEALGLASLPHAGRELWAWRDAEGFEEARRAVERARAAGREPRVHLDTSAATPRDDAAWTRRLLATAGLATVPAGEATTGEGTVVVVGGEPGAVAERARRLRAAGAETVLAVGRQEGEVPHVDGFLHRDADMRGTLELLLARLGVPR